MSGANGIAWPHNATVEASMLGALLCHPNMLSAFTALEPDSFHLPQHRVVFAAMRNLEAAGSPIDVATLEAEIERGGKLGAIGGVAFLGELAMTFPTIENVHTYAEIVLEDARNRRALVAIGEVYLRACKWPHDADEMVSELIGQLQRIETHGATLTPSATIAADVARLETPPIRSYPSGNMQLDRLIGGGINTRELLTVLGPPGAGKSAWAVSTSIYVQQRIPVLYCSTELEQHELMARIAANVLNKPWSGVRRGTMPRVDVVAALDGIRIYVIGCDVLPRDGDAALKMIEREATRLSAESGEPPLVVVDYLQDLARGNERDLRARVGDYASALRAMAQRLDGPMIAVGSVARTFYSARRAAELREANDATVYLSAAKESGDIDYAAARVLFLDVDPDSDRPERPVRIAVAKSRDGRVGFAGARFVGETGRWRDAPDAVDELGTTRATKGADDSDKNAEAKVLAAVIARHGRGERELCTKRQLRSGCGIAVERVTPALERLVHAGKLQIAQIERLEGQRVQTRDVYEPTAAEPAAKPNLTGTRELPL